MKYSRLCWLHRAELLISVYFACNLSLLLLGLVVVVFTGPWKSCVLFSVAWKVCEETVLLEVIEFDIQKRVGAVSLIALWICLALRSTVHTGSGTFYYNCWKLNLAYVNDICFTALHYATYITEPFHRSLTVASALCSVFFVFGFDLTFV